MNSVTFNKLTYAHELFRITDWFKVSFCPSWQLSWWFEKTMVTHPSVVLCIAVIPFIMIQIGVSK